MSMVCIRGEERLTLQVMMLSMRIVKCKGLKPLVESASDEGAMVDLQFRLCSVLVRLGKERVISTKEEETVTLYDTLRQSKQLQCSLKTVTGDPRYDT